MFDFALTNRYCKFRPVQTTGPFLSVARHVFHTCARHIEVICALDAGGHRRAEMELHSKVARLCLQTAKRPGEGERVRDG